MKRYTPAMAHKDDVYLFAYHIVACGYCTAKPEDYAAAIRAISRDIEKA